MSYLYPLSVRIVAIPQLDQAVLQVFDEQMSQEPGLTEAEAFNRAIETAHEEDMAVWKEAIEPCLRQARLLFLLTALRSHLQRPLVELWLGLLLGGYHLEQRGEFYDLQQVWVGFA